MQLKHLRTNVSDNTSTIYRQVGIIVRRFVQSIQHRVSTIMLQCETVLRLSPALLVGSSVVRRSLTHHSHVAVFGHDSVTFSEHWPLIREGTHY